VSFWTAYIRLVRANSATANNLDTIPAPLLDRMEVIEVSGYVSEEKSMIAEKYLGPQAREASGLKNADVILDPTSVDVLIKYYCRESGVRNLKKHIEKVKFTEVVPVDDGTNWASQIYRKTALKIIQDLGEEAFPEVKAVKETEEATKDELSEPAKSAAVAELTDTQSKTGSSNTEERSNVTTEERKPLKVPNNVHVRITPDNLKDYVGPPVYQKDRMYAHPPPPGVSTGLGYLGNGSGAVMPVEASVRRTGFISEKVPF